MEGLLRSIIPTPSKYDDIQEMAKYLESLGIFSMYDMVKTCETALKKSNHFNMVSIGKIKDHLQKDYPEVLETFKSNDLKILDNERDKAKQKEEDLKNAMCKMEHLDECMKEEIKMLDNEEKDFKERLRKLEELRHEMSFHKKKSDDWKKLIDDIDYANKQLQLNKKLREERKNHYKDEKKNLRIIFQ